MKQIFKVGILKIVLEERRHNTFDQVIDETASRIREQIADRLELNVEVFRFSGPILSPTRGSYSPLDLLQLGLAEKLEREINFLLIVMEEDLLASARSYVLAMPSQMMNIGVVSIKRLSPSFWGEEPDLAVTTQRLTALMSHTLGHLLNLEHVEEIENIMYPFSSVHDLDHMSELTDSQIMTMQENIPVEAHEEVAQKRRWLFALKHIFANTHVILQSITNTNPLYLVIQLPTVLTAAFSVIIVLFFTAEIWDVASVLQFQPLIIFSIIAICSSTAVFYATFRIGSNQARRGLSETSVVLVSATVATLLTVNMMLYLIFLAVTVISALTIFPDELKTAWPTVSGASGFVEQVKLGMFLATMGVLTGSLGGKADSRAIIQQVLFLDEET